MSGTIEPVMTMNGTPPPGPQVSKASAPSVIKAINGVTKRIHEVPKSGTNDKDKYAFVTVADLNAVLQDAMAGEGLVIAQREIEKKIVSKILMIKYEFDAYHTSGESIIGITSHTGACRFEFKSGATDDKSVSKCYVSAAKYMALGLFKIPTDDYTVERLSDGDADKQGINDDFPPEPTQFDHRSIRDDRRTDRREPEPERSDDRRQTDRSEDRRRDPPEDRRRDDRLQDQPRNFADDPPFDGPPDWGNPPPPDIDERGPPDIPYAGGTVTPPPQSPDEVSYRNRLMSLMADLKGAMDEKTAAQIWTDERNAQLLRSASDVTYEHFRMAYFDRHKAYPPAT